jgi:Excalibur calcium-binding domain
MSIGFKSGVIPLAALGTFIGVYTLTPTGRDGAVSSPIASTQPAAQPQSQAMSARKMGAFSPQSRQTQRPKSTEYTFSDQQAANYGVAQAPPGNAALEDSPYFSGCNQVRAAGLAPLYRGQPGYRAGMDGDNDGIACEPYRGR